MSPATLDAPKEYLLADEAIAMIEARGHGAELRSDGSIRVTYRCRKGALGFDAVKLFTPSNASTEIDLYRSAPIRVFLGDGE